MYYITYFYILWYYIILYIYTYSCFDWTEHSPCARCYSTGAHCCKNENTVPHHLGSATKTWLKSRSSSWSCAQEKWQRCHMISGMLTNISQQKERQSFSCLEDLAFFSSCCVFHHISGSWCHSFRCLPSSVKEKSTPLRWSATRGTAKL